MGVDYYACEECGEIYGDCGDEWYMCEDGHRICKYCLGIADGEVIERDDNGYLLPKYCLACQSEAEYEASRVKVPVADTWLLIRNDNGYVIGHYVNLRYARGRRTALKPLETTIVKVVAVEGCEYPE